MITKLRRNLVGTVSFDGKFGNQRKAQSFIVYPLGQDANPTRILVQSNTRIGHIYLLTGLVTMSPPIASGAYGVHLGMAEKVATLSGEELTLLKAHIIASAGGRVGTRGVLTDNSGALEVGVA